MSTCGRLGEVFKIKGLGVCVNRVAWFGGGVGVNPDLLWGGALVKAEWPAACGVVPEGGAVGPFGGGGVFTSEM